MKRKEIRPSADLSAERRFREILSRFSFVELRLMDLIPRKVFWKELSAVRADYSLGGRSSYDEVLLFNRPILRTRYRLFDEALEIETYRRTPSIKTFDLFLTIVTNLIITRRLL